MKLTKPPRKEYPDLWEYKKEVSDSYVHNFDVKNRLTAVDDTKKYIGIGFIADIHLGNDGVLYRLAEAHGELIAKTDNCYAVLGGDAIDNFINQKILPAMLASTTSPKGEIYLLEKYLSFFGDNIMAMISGNHERWTKEITGLDFISGIAKDNKIMYSPEDFFITVKLGEIEYEIYIRHKYRFNSSFNQTHSVKQMLRLSDYTFDIGVVCHHHEPAIETGIWKQKKRVYIRPGSYKIADTFSRKIGFNKAVAIMPFVVLDPFKKNMTAIDSIEEGVEFLNYKNSKL